jgi:transposase
METIRDRVAGLDVHRDKVVGCCRLVESRRVRLVKGTFSTMSTGIAELAEWLSENRVTTAVMESTGVYWKGAYYGLEGLVDELWLVNAAHVKRVPGRKTDVSDAEWLADVTAHGMVRASYVPPPLIRELRELTRYRKTQVEARGPEIQRLEKLLQDAGVKLSSVASSVWSKSAKAMVEALITGERDPDRLAEMSLSVMRAKKDRLSAAFTGTNFSAHRAVVARQILDHIAFLDTSVARLTDEIVERCAPFESVISLLCEIPGLGPQHRGGVHRRDRRRHERVRHARPACLMGGRGSRHARMGRQATPDRLAHREPLVEQGSHGVGPVRCCAICAASPQRKPLRRPAQNHGSGAPGRSGGGQTQLSEQIAD